MLFMNSRPTRAYVNFATSATKVERRSEPLQFSDLSPTLLDVKSVILDVNVDSDVKEVGLIQPLLDSSHPTPTAACGLLYCF